MSWLVVSYLRVFDFFDYPKRNYFDYPQSYNFDYAQRNDFDYPLRNSFRIIDQNANQNLFIDNLFWGREYLSAKGNYG
jgi:hypothetical protein